MAKYLKFYGVAKCIMVQKTTLVKKDKILNVKIITLSCLQKNPQVRNSLLSFNGISQVFHGLLPSIGLVGNPLTASESLTSANFPRNIAEFLRRMVC